MKIAGHLMIASLLLGGLTPMKSTAQQQESHAQEDYPFAIKLDEIIPTRLRENNVPGFALGVIENGQVAFTRGYGYANMQTRRPMTDSTILNVASISKPVTAWGVMQLIETHKLDLDAPVVPLLSRWTPPESPFDNNDVTIRRLLSHTAGTGLQAAPFFPADSTRPSLEKVLAGQAGSHGPLRIEQEPGSKWSYSGGGYTMLQLLVEEVSGMPFDEYMRKTVFAPLGMTSTSFILPYLISCVFCKRTLWSPLKKLSVPLPLHS